MVTKIALFGAGGKMGYRLASNLKTFRFRGSPRGAQPAGQELVKTGLGLHCVPADEALDGAEVVILAVPDTAIGKVASSIEGELKPGTMIMTLDAAAPFAGHLPKRDDLTYFVTHPCHPPVFNDETDLAAKRDYFGGIAAKQHIVCSLMQGPGERLHPGRADRTSDLGARDALPPGHVGTNGAAGAGPFGDRLRDAAGGDARSHG